MKVFKYGGSSVADPDRIRRIARRFAVSAEHSLCKAVVFSAFSGVTDQLGQMARQAAAGDDRYYETLTRLSSRHVEAVREMVAATRQTSAMAEVKYMLNELEDVLQGIHLIKECTPRSLDLVCSFGERLSAWVIHVAFREHGVECDFVDARDMIVTSSRYGNAEVRMEPTLERIRTRLLASERLCVVTGFIAADESGITTTLGRGGSDYTAALLAAALNADELQIWTDVDGVLTADPLHVREAFPVRELSYEEAMELSHFGARVIYPPTIEPVMSREIPLRIKNSLNPEFPGTLVVANPRPDPMQIIRGVSSIDRVSLLRIQGSGLVGMAGIAQRIFGALAAGGINIILISQGSSEHSVCLAVLPEDAEKAGKLLAGELEYELARRKVADIITEHDMSIVAVVGEHMRNTPGIAGRVFQALGRSHINISAIAQGSSELNISVVIRRDQKHRALRVIHDAFFFGARKTAHIYVIGTGLIGRQLIDDMFKRYRYFLQERLLDLRISGVMNTRHMLLSEEGIDADGWEERLAGEGVPASLSDLLAHVGRCQSPNTIIVDATASETVPQWYERFLVQGIAVVTPNKKANTGSLEVYQRLTALARDSETRFLYETNVGAGLPFVQAVQDRVSTGDRIHRIEGVFSGTLSYLFNHFDGSRPFSELVADARRNGYTEPDPRDDLNGMDAARKLLILARIAGHSVSLDDIIVESLVPEELRDLPDAESFLARLPEYDSLMAERLQNAQSRGRKLCYLARMDQQGLRVSLEEVESGDPVSGLSGSENMITVFTEAYNQSPLVLRGPGAGPAVTANGVLCDILKAIK